MPNFTLSPIFSLILNRPVGVQNESFTSPTPLIELEIG
ncbi:MAG: hypothetical protein Rpha_1704 [Candidatus Ruthia sp. Apha_13_S6]|nr:hypothetical protein [Candidatus Ruthia sp. Apha_13_S6]